jgi:tetratricopeptide (TPR) repeat protein
MSAYYQKFEELHKLLDRKLGDLKHCYKIAGRQRTLTAYDIFNSQKVNDYLRREGDSKSLVPGEIDEGLLQKRFAIAFRIVSQDHGLQNEDPAFCANAQKILNTAREILKDRQKESAYSAWIRARFRKEPEERLAEADRARQQAEQEKRKRRASARYLIWLGIFLVVGLFLVQFLSPKPLVTSGLPAATPTIDAKAYFDSGKAFYDKKLYEAAIGDFSNAIRLAPNSAAAYKGRGRAYTAQFKLYMAIPDFDEAIRLDPNDAAAYNGRGTAYLGWGKYDKAISDFNEAIRLDPNLAAAYNGRGSAYLWWEYKYDKAISDYNEAIRLDPNDADAYYGRGTAYYRESTFDKAITDYNEAIRLDPNNATIYESRGNAYYIEGKLDKAVIDYNEAIRLDPNHAVIERPDGSMYPRQ